MEYKRNFYQIKSNDEIFEKIHGETSSVGYYKLPFEEISHIKDYSLSVKKKNIVLIGIGGSSLGVKAIYHFLLSSKNFEKKLFAIDSIDPLKINFNLRKIDLANSHFIVVSKSGSTIEPISILKYLNELCEINTTNSTIISEEGTSLHRYAKLKKIKFFKIPKNVGGRFSVFSHAGLVPLAIIGVDIQQLLNGCQKIHNDFFNKGYYFDLIMNKARFLVENKNRFNINVIFSYSFIFEQFNKWFVQLWAESLGKLNINGTRQGLTPVGLIGPDDQHSFLQLIMDGPRDKTITFFKIRNLKDESTIPNNKDFDIFDLNYLNNISFNKLLCTQADSTIKAIDNLKDIPYDVITIETVDEYNVAKLMYRFQLLVSCIGSFLQINAYDQPAVESGKKILKEIIQNGS